MASIGKLIAIRIFSSRSAPADSVWNALDSARRAAMTDDLAHVPSIARIANVFTKMLEQLQVNLLFRLRSSSHSRQGMKRNRNDFYEITNEIGKLMESIVQYAKQHGTTSQRFTELCDGFLRWICLPLWRASWLATLSDLVLCRLCNQRWNNCLGPLRSALQMRRHINKFYLLTISESSACAVIYR